jgi:hypothetical protein
MVTAINNINEFYNIRFTGRLGLLDLGKFIKKTNALYKISQTLWAVHENRSPEEQLISQLRAMAPKEKRLVIEANPAPRKDWRQVGGKEKEDFASENFMEEFKRNAQMFSDLKKTSKLYSLLESETNWL